MAHGSTDQSLALGPVKLQGFLENDSTLKNAASTSTTEPTPRCWKCSCCKPVLNFVGVIGTANPHNGSRIEKVVSWQTHLRYTQKRTVGYLPFNHLLLGPRSRHRRIGRDVVADVFKFPCRDCFHIRDIKDFLVGGHSPGEIFLALGRDPFQLWRNKGLVHTFEGIAAGPVQSAEFLYQL